jgi:hypothetical protein
MLLPALLAALPPQLLLMMQGLPPSLLEPLVGHLGMSDSATAASTWSDVGLDERASQQAFSNCKERRRTYLLS